MYPEDLTTEDLEAARAHGYLMGKAAAEALAKIALDAAEERERRLREGLEWIETYVTNQPLDSLAQFLITKKVRDALKEDHGMQAGASI